jgi:hypothetical protein
VLAAPRQGEIRYPQIKVRHVKVEQGCQAITDVPQVPRRDVSVEDQRWRRLREQCVKPLARSVGVLEEQPRCFCVLTVVIGQNVASGAAAHVIASPVPGRAIG